MQKSLTEKLYQTMAFFLLIGFLCCGCSSEPDVSMTGVLLQTEREETEDTENIPVSEESSETEQWIQVHVCGAVEHPGVYRLREGVRIYEAVEAAGGFCAEADQEWLNLADLLQDGQKLRIYTAEETGQMRENGEQEQGLAADDSGRLEAKDSQEEGKINLNTAGKEQLMTLPGIGESKAEAIISYREEQGMFQKIEEIMNISGIKDAVFLKIKDKIVV